MVSNGKSLVIKNQVNNQYYFYPLKRTPLDFALKIRHYPDAINITSKNKMRHAEKILYASDLSLSVVEGHMLFNDEKINLQNRQIVKNFLCLL